MPVGFDCDLHAHSSVSDGTDPPRALVAAAAFAGLRAVALTDHDTHRGNADARDEATRLGLGFLPGVELSADAAALRDAPGDRPDDDARLGTLHLLGYGIRDGDDDLQRIYDAQRAARATRNPEILDKLRGLGYVLTNEEVLAEADRRSNNIAVVGRPHIAQALIRKGYVASVDQAFATLIGEGKPAYARRDTLPPGQAVDAIHHAGGVAILAHPVQLHPRDKDHLAAILRRAVDLGIDGVETRHSDHEPDVVQRLTELADDLGLLTTGGSDYHGDRKAIALGSSGCTLAQFEALAEAIAARGGDPGVPPVAAGRDA